MLNINLQFGLFTLSALCSIVQVKNVLCYVSSNNAIDPFGLLRPGEGVTFLKTNCVELCKECNGIAKLEGGVCKCQILTDYPVKCLERIQRKSQILGVKLVSKSPLRTKRCLGSGTGFPLPMFGVGISKTANNQLTEMGDQMVGEPTEAMNTLVGIVTAPLMEQIRAIFGGDNQMAQDTIPGQIVANLPKALSTLTSMFDALNVASNRVGNTREAEGTGENLQSGDMTTDLLGSIPMVNELRAVFVGDPYTGNVEYTLPVQFARTLPVAANSLMELMSSFGNMGAMGMPRDSSASNPRPLPDKSWLDEDDDDDVPNDTTTNDKTDSSLGNPAKIIVSPFQSNGKPVEELATEPPIQNQDPLTSSGYDEFNMLDALIRQNVGDSLKNFLSSPDTANIIRPQEAVIIISPTSKLTQTFVDTNT